MHEQSKTEKPTANSWINWALIHMNAYPRALQKKGTAENSAVHKQKKGTLIYKRFELFGFRILILVIRIGGVGCEVYTYPNGVCAWGKGFSFGMAGTVQNVKLYKRKEQS